MTLYRDPVKIDPKATDADFCRLSILGPDGKETLISAGTKTEIEGKAYAIRAAIKQAIFETLRGLTEQIR